MDFFKTHQNCYFNQQSVFFKQKGQFLSQKYLILKLRMEETILFDEDRSKWICIKLPNGSVYFGDVAYTDKEAMIIVGRFFRDFLSFRETERKTGARIQCQSAPWERSPALFERRQ
jgi:hypothetical protein